MEVFSARLKWLREQQRYSQREIAEKLGMSLSGYAKIEYGEREPKLDALRYLAELFDESLDFMLGLTDYDKGLRRLNGMMDNMQEIIAVQQKEIVFMTVRVEEGNKRTELLNLLDHAKQEYIEYQQNFEQLVLEFNEYAKTIPFFKGSKERSGRRS